MSYDFYVGARHASPLQDTDFLDFHPDFSGNTGLQHLAQCLTRSVRHWRPKGVATDSGFHRSERAERVNGYENRCIGSTLTICHLPKSLYCTREFSSDQKT